jgi:hypothetical protein
MIPDVSVIFYTPRSPLKGLAACAIMRFRLNLMSSCGSNVKLHLNSICYD